ncbi:MAG: hypothetical protein GY835_10000, partial [bacterium]|nr:hypothetical protein [bacterium]
QERRKAAERRKVLREEAANKLRFMDNKAPEQLELAFREGLERLKAVRKPGAPEVIDTLLRFEDRVAQIEGAARLVVPGNLSIRGDRELKRLRHSHTNAYDVFSGQCHEIRHKFQDAVREEFPQAEHAASERRTLEMAYSQMLARIGKAQKALRDEVDAQIKSLDADLDGLHAQQRSRVDQVLMYVTGTTTVEEARATEIENLTELLGTMSEATETSIESLDEHRKRLPGYLAGYFGEARDELIGAQTGEIEELREKVDQNLELVQLGLAVEIIDHDLNKLFLGIRASLSRLRNL